MLVGFLSDIHEDIVSLELALGLLDRHGCDRIVCLGDIVGFALPFYQYIRSRDAEACVSRIRSRCSVVVAGNHDLYAVRRVPRFQAGFDYGPDWYGLEYTVRERRARNRIWLYEDNEIPPVLSPSSCEYLRDLPETERPTFDDTMFLLSHFCYPDLSGSAIHFPTQAFHLRAHFDFMHGEGCRIGVSGHGHPEGCLIVDEERITLHPFGTVALTREPQWIVGPCVARTSRANGCMILNTARWELQVLPLRDARSAQA